MRTAEGIDYEAVLEDLRAKRAQLDAAISVIEQLMPVQLITNRVERSEDIATGELRLSSGIRVGTDSFFGLTAGDAARKFLRMAKKPQSTKTIHDAVLEGGYTTTAKNFYSNLYTALVRSDEFVNLGGRKGWGLAEWYPGRRTEKRRPDDSSGTGEASEGTNAADEGRLVSPAKEATDVAVDDAAS